MFLKESITVTADGIVSFIQNGQTQEAGQLELTIFPNTSGLQPVGENLFVEPPPVAKPSTPRRPKMVRGTFCRASWKRQRGPHQRTHQLDSHPTAVRNERPIHPGGRRTPPRSGKPSPWLMPSSWLRLWLRAASPCSTRCGWRATRPLTLGEVAKLEGEACRYHALEVPQGQPDDPIDLGFVIDFLDHCAAPVFRWEFRGVWRPSNAPALPSIKEPTPIAAPTPALNPSARSLPSDCD